MYKNSKESLSRLKSKRHNLYDDWCCPNTLRVLIANPVEEVCRNFNEHVVEKLEIGPIRLAYVLAAPSRLSSFFLCRAGGRVRLHVSYQYVKRKKHATLSKIF